MATRGTKNTFDDSSSEDQMVVEKTTKPKRKQTAAAVYDKHSDEEELERLVFGDTAGFRQQLRRDDFLSFAAPAGSTTALRLVGEDKDATSLEHVDDADLFILDTAPTSRGSQVAAAEPDPSNPGSADAPAWADSDDERLTVSLATATRLRKLRAAEGEDVVSGTEYARRLRQQFLRLSPVPAWAREAAARPAKRRRASASASARHDDVDNIDDDDDDDDDDKSGSDAESDAGDFSIQPLAGFLRDASGLAVAPKRRRLRPETVDIQRSRDVPVSHRAPVTSLSFHPTEPILLSSSPAGILYLNRIDPAAHPTPNPELLSVHPRRVDVRRSEFLGPAGNGVFFAGRRRYVHRWNLDTGLVQRTSQVLGHKLEHRSMESFRTSPCGRWVAICASSRRGGGSLSVVDAETMQWVATARSDSRHGIADFAWWRDGDGIIILGTDGRVGEWSLPARSFLAVWQDEGSISGTVIALGGSQGPQTAGGDRWVAVGSSSGILNLYDRRHLFSSSEDGGAGNDGGVKVPERPTPTKTFEQLVTPVTTLAFSPDGQLLAFASQSKKDAVRLVHLQSCTVYRNWPTQQTPLGRVTAMAFAKHELMLAVGNDAGKVRLWDIRG